MLTLWFIGQGTSCCSFWGKSNRREHFSVLSTIDDLVVMARDITGYQHCDRYYSARSGIIAFANDSGETEISWKRETIVYKYHRFEQPRRLSGFARLLDSLLIFKLL